MTRTTNYHLPQWDAHDPVRREDFNGAFAALDEVYSPQNKPAACVSCSASGKAVGDVIYTFAKAPAFILLFAGYGPALITQGGFGAIMDYSTYNSNYYAQVQLSGKQLILKAKGTSFVGSSLRAVVVY